MALVVISALTLFLWVMSHVADHTWEIGGEYNYAEYNEAEEVWYGRNVYEADPLFLRVECARGQMHVHLATKYFRNWDPNCDLFNDFNYYLIINRSTFYSSLIIAQLGIPLMTVFSLFSLYPAIIIFRGPLRRYFSHHKKLLNFLYVGGPFICLIVIFLFTASMLFYSKVHCFRLLFGFLEISFGQIGFVDQQTQATIPAVMFHQLISPEVYLLPKFTLHKTPFYISWLIPLWIPFLIFAYYPFYKRVYIPLMQRLGRCKLDNHNPCAKCGYNLTGNQSGVCPECGTSIK